MYSPPNLIENRAPWLDAAVVRVCRLPRELPPAPGVEELTLQMLRSIEAEDIPVPTACVTRRGAIRLEWHRDVRCLVVFVTGEDSFRGYRFRSGRPIPGGVDVSADRVERLRRMLGWLCPTANAGDVRYLPAHPGWMEEP